MTEILLTWLLGWAKKGQKGNRIFTQKHLHKAEMLDSLFNHSVTILITYRWRKEE